MTGNLTFSGWGKCNAGEYGNPGENVIWGMGTSGGASEGLLLDVGISANTILSAVAFRAGGTELQSFDFLTGSNSNWFAWAWRHTGGTAVYDFSYLFENQLAWTTHQFTLTAEITTVGGGIFVGSDQFGEDALNSDSRSFFCQQVRMTDAQLLAAAQNINVPPNGVNLHWLKLLNAGSATTNLGTAGAVWTSTGTLQTAASEPNIRSGNSLFFGSGA